MWHAAHDLSATQVHHHPSITTYQHYASNQNAHHHHNGNMSKWNVAGQRSSYSLPHPGHAQSHQRWQKHDDKHTVVPVPVPVRHLSNSTRNLAVMPPNASFVHSIQLDGRPMYGGRPRPASMYDTPNNMPNSMPIMNYNHHQRAASPHQNGFFMPSSKKDAMRQQQQQHQHQQPYASSNQHNNHVNNNNNTHNHNSNGLRQSPGELVRNRIQHTNEIINLTQLSY